MRRFLRSITGPGPFLASLLTSIFLAAIFAPEPADAAGVVDLAGKLASGQDAWPALQAAADNADGPTEIRVPAGNFALTRPVIIDKPGVTVRGAGRDLTSFGAWGPSGFVFGLRRADGTARLTDAHFPTAAGTLDATASDRVGLRTLGNAVWQFSNHPWCYGGPAASDPGSAYDHFGDLAGYTVNLAFSPNGSRKLTLASLGNSWADPEPYWIGTTDGPTPDSLSLYVLYRLAGDALYQGAPVRRAWCTVPAAGVVRLAVVWDFAGGVLWARVGGLAVSMQGETQLPARFPRVAGAYPFDVAHEGPGPPSGPVPDLTVWGLRTVAAAVRADEGGDRARYFDADAPGTIAALAGARDAAYRVIPTTDGPAAVGGRVARAGWGFSTVRTDGTFLGYNGLFDLSVSGGSPSVLLGMVGYFRAERAGFNGATAGLGSAPLGVSYQTRLRDLTLSGNEAPLNLFGHLADLTAVDVIRCGTTYGRFFGCAVNWRGGLFAWSTNETRSALEFYGYPLGGSHRVEDVLVDNEGVDLADSVILCESTPYTSSSLIVSNVAAARLGPAATFLHLVGCPPGVAKPASVSALGLTLSGGGGVGPVRVDGGPAWTGRVDGSTLPAGAAVGPHAADVATK